MEATIEMNTLYDKATQTPLQRDSKILKIYKKNKTENGFVFIDYDYQRPDIEGLEAADPFMATPLSNTDLVGHTSMYTTYRRRPERILNLFSGFDKQWPKYRSDFKTSLYSVYQQTDSFLKKLILLGLQVNRVDITDDATVFVQTSKEDDSYYFGVAFPMADEEQNNSIEIFANIFKSEGKNIGFNGSVEVVMNRLEKEILGF